MNKASSGTANDCGWIGDGEGATETRSKAAEEMVICSRLIHIALQAVQPATNKKATDLCTDWFQTWKNTATANKLPKPLSFATPSESSAITKRGITKSQTQTANKLRYALSLCTLGIIQCYSRMNRDFQLRIRL
jgi:hypothetical protein